MTEETIVPEDHRKALWKRVCVTDPKHVKPITGKQYKGNSPKPYWIVERLTDEFGPCGLGWGFSILSERMERLTDTDVLHVAVVRLWYVMDGKRGELEQIGQTKAAYQKNDGHMMTDEDAPKKSVTDALVKCASYLGFAGDIFSGMWDDSKYVAWARDQYTEDQPAKPDPVAPSFRSSATMGVFEQLPPGRQSVIVDCVDAIKERMGADDVIGAYEIASSLVDSEEKTALWGKLDSKTRSAITKHSQSLKKAA